MARPILTDFLHRLATRMAAETLEQTCDRELVRKVIAECDEASMQAIVNRHGPMVYRVCWRVLQHSQDAEDAFQATFLVLAQNLRSLRKQSSLASWLHGVAHRLALKARAQSKTRRRREQQLEPASMMSPDQMSWGELRSVLDDELDRLPNTWRQPLILCYLKGRTQDEAAGLLGWSKSTLRRRLEEARTRLASRLNDRGIVLPAALSTVLLSECASCAALSPALFGSVATAMTGVVVGCSLAALPPRVLAIMHGVRNTMLLAKLKAGAVVLAFVGLAIVGISGANRALHDLPAASEAPASQSESATPASASKMPDPTAGEPAKVDEAAARPLRVAVLDPDGKPLPGARVRSGIWTNEKGFKANHDYLTDERGVAQVELPKTFYILRIWASKKPFVAMFANWEQNELAGGQKVPAEYTIRLESASSAGGRIVDENDKPVAGAQVQVSIQKSPSPQNGDGRTRYHMWLAEGKDAVQTDAEGRWRVDNVPDREQIELNLLIMHPDFVSDEAWRGIQTAAGITTPMLRQQAAIVKLKRGAIVTGRVVDPAGKPLKDALVIRGNDPYFSSTVDEFLTDADGRYRLPAMAPKETTLTVIAPGWAPQLWHVSLPMDPPPQNFQMLPGKPIKLKFTDVAGKPVAGVFVRIAEWQGSKSLHNFDHPKVRDTKIPRLSDVNGIWEWTWAPEDLVKLEISSKNYATIKLEIAGGAAMRTLVLKSEHRIVGRITDAVTGKPIPDFAVIPVNVFRKDWLSAERSNGVSGKNGKLDYLATRPDYPLRLRIEAKGYRTQDGPEFHVGDDSPRTQNFRLQPSPSSTGKVVDASGQAVAEAELSLATPTEIIELDERRQNNTAKTDATGRFTYPDAGEPLTLIAEAKAGFAIADFPSGQHEMGTLQLRPWSSIRGEFLDGGRPVAGATIIVDFVRSNSVDRPRIQTTKLQVATDSKGRFEFPRVPPIAVAVRVYLGPWRDEMFRSGPSVPLNLQPGQNVELKLGTGGASVAGKVKLTGEKLPADLDCTFSLNYLVRRAPGIAPPAEIAALGFDSSNGWSESWEQTPEGRAFMGTLQHWFVKLAPDGSCRVSGVPQGEYDLSVRVYSKPSGCLVDPIARAVVPVSVTAEDVARGTISLPEITAPVVPIPAVGDTPKLAFLRNDGKAGSLADHRGKFMLVHFWASWCAPCKQQLPAVRKLHERFASRGLFMLGLSVENDNAAWLAATQKLDLAWSQARLAAASRGGVSSVPTYWLLDPTGKIVAKSNDVDELAKLIGEHLE